MFHSKMSQLTGGVLAGTLSAFAAPAFAQDGGTLFKQRCAMCHTIVSGAKPGIGPNLVGLSGRKSGATEFVYSPALKKAALKWDKATLDTFLTAPGKLVPGTRMVVSVPDAKQRTALVAYLVSLKK